MADTPLILGVDGGGSKTIARLAQLDLAGEESGWNLLGQGRSTVSNQQAAGQTHATQALEEAITRAFEDARLPVQPISSICLALAGCDRSSDKDFIREWSEQFIPAKQLCIVNDAEPLLIAGTPDQWGITLIAGTGSLSWGRNADGRTARAGGWGYLIGDEGSGFACGQAALRAATQNADGRGPATTLLPKLLEYFQCQEPAELVPAVYHRDQPQSEIAALAPIVLAEAIAEDSLALEIVTQAAQSLATMIESVAAQLSLSAPFPLVLAGGLLTSSPLLQDLVCQQLQNHDLTPEPIQVLTSAIEGTLQLAQQMHQP